MFSMLRVPKGFDLTTGASQDNTNDAWNILSNYQWTMEDAMKMIRKSGERREGEMEREGGREREREGRATAYVYIYTKQHWSVSGMPWDTLPWLLRP